MFYYTPVGHSDKLLALRLTSNPMKDCVSRCHAEIRTVADMKHFPTSKKTWPTINVLDRNKSNKRELLILEFLIKQ